MAVVIPGHPAPEEHQPFQPSMNAEVQPGATHFKTQKDPWSYKTLIVPDALMEQVVGLWLQTHPQEASNIIRSFRDKQKNEMNIIQHVNRTKL
jgi:hypothetical protein